MRCGSQTRALSVSNGSLSVAAASSALLRLSHHASDPQEMSYADSRLATSQRMHYLPEYIPTSRCLLTHLQIKECPFFPKSSCFLRETSRNVLFFSFFPDFLGTALNCNEIGFLPKEKNSKKFM